MSEFKSIYTEDPFKDHNLCAALMKAVDGVEDMKRLNQILFVYRNCNFTVSNQTYCGTLGDMYLLSIGVHPTKTYITRTLKQKIEAINSFHRSYILYAISIYPHILNTSLNNTEICNIEDNQKDIFSKSFSLQNSILKQSIWDVVLQY